MFLATSKQHFRVIFVFLLFQYLNIVRYLKYYGYVQFAPCYCDYPQRNSRVLLAIGGNELNLRVLSSEEHEVVFKVSRMRCWRITTIQNVSVTNILIGKFIGLD